MTIDEYLKATSTALQQAGIESARLDALILLEDALKMDRAVLLAHPEDEIPDALAAKLYKQRVAREKHVPLAYIRGHAPFYGREFMVNNHVLVPRPETEALVTLLKKHAPYGSPEDPVIIADVGTGSGILGITAALEVHDTQIFLYDISPEALEVAHKNADALHVPATLEQHDLLEDVSRHHDVILANLPYVPDLMHINRAAAHEPKLALFSGPDGLDHYKTFWNQLAQRADKPALVVTESLPSQHHVNAQLARTAGFFLADRLDFAQAFQPL
jgi:release factor glutamine methyltransferase